MSTLNLGKIRFNWTGAYNNSTAYVANDVVSSGGNSYICILASTGNAVSNATYWSIMSSAGTNGTNGTDLGTVLTAQGDVVYRDGSGLQRLAKGTAGQALVMNSSANAPEWGSGGAWSVKTNTTFSGVQSVDTTSITKPVIIYLTDLSHSTSMSIGFRTSTNNGTSFDNTSGDYAFGWSRITTDMGDGSSTVYSRIKNSFNYCFINAFGAGGGSGTANITIYIPNPASTTNYKHISFEYFGRFEDGSQKDLQNARGSMVRESNDAINAFQVKVDSGTFSGSVKVLEMP